MLGNFSGTYITYVLLLYARRETVALASTARSRGGCSTFAAPYAGYRALGAQPGDRFQVSTWRRQEPVCTGGVEDLARIMLPIAAFQTAWVLFANCSPTRTRPSAPTGCLRTGRHRRLGGRRAEPLRLPTSTCSCRATGGGVAGRPLLTAGSALYGAYDPLNRRQPLEADEAHAGRERDRRRHQHRPQLPSDPGLGIVGAGARRSSAAAPPAGLRQRPGRLPGVARLGRVFGRRASRRSSCCCRPRSCPRPDNGTRHPRSWPPARARPDGRPQPRRAPPNRPAPGRCAVRGGASGWRRPSSSRSSRRRRHRCD